MTTVMKRALALGFLCAGSWLLPADACHGQIRINEIVADPASDWNGDGVVSFRDDEWIEIVNIGPGSVALDSLRLCDASGVFRYGFSGVLAAGARQVVYGSDSVAWESAEGFSAVGLSLNNAGDSVLLLELTGTDTLLVDDYTYQAHEVLDDRSTARMPDGDGMWVLFDGLNPYTGTDPPVGTGCNPTPGETNACPTAVEGATWGAVKSLYSSPLEVSRDH